jgi:hypothetical protein
MGKAHVRLDRDSQLDPIIWGVHQILLRTKVPLGGLNRRMSEEQLYLFQFSASRPAHFRAAPPQIVRRDTRHTSCRRISLE